MHGVLYFCLWACVKPHFPVYWELFWIFLGGGCWCVPNVVIWGRRSNELRTQGANGARYEKDV